MPKRIVFDQFSYVCAKGCGTFRDEVGACPNCGSAGARVVVRPDPPEPAILQTEGGEHYSTTERVR